MRSVRHILLMCTFTFFAAWFLCLVTGRSFRLPELQAPGPVLQLSPPTPPVVKPSPIDMLKLTGNGTESASD